MLIERRHTNKHVYIDSRVIAYVYARIYNNEYVGSVAIPS